MSLFDTTPSPSHIDWQTTARSNAAKLREGAAKAESAIERLQRNKEITASAKAARTRAIRSAAGVHALEVLAETHGSRHGGMTAAKGALRVKPPADATETLIAMRELDRISQLPVGRLLDTLRHSDRARYLVAAIAGDLERQELQRQVADQLDIGELCEEVTRAQRPGEWASVDQTQQELDATAELASRIAAQASAGLALSEKDVIPSRTIAERTHIEHNRRYTDPSWAGAEDPVHRADVLAFEKIAGSVPQPDQAPVFT